MSANPSELPATAAQWHQQAVDTDVKSLSIFDGEACESGSNITHRQFLLLKVLWLKKDQNCFSRTVQSWIPHNELEESKTPPESHMELESVPQVIQTDGLGA
jgi:hypothetical protein